MEEEDKEAGSPEGEWEPDDLLEMVSHDLVNQQQAAIGFLELLEESPSLSEAELALVEKTVEVLEETARLFIQARASLVRKEWREFLPVQVSLDRALMVACRTVQGAFARERVTVEPRGTGGNVEVKADGMLADMLTQLMMALVVTAPLDRKCRLTVEVEPGEASVALRFSSEGFALNPMLTDSLTADRDPPGRTREAATISLVRQMLKRYEGSAGMETAPPGGVGAHLVIRLPSGTEVHAVDNDSR